MKTIRATNLKRIKEISSNVKSFVSFTIDNDFAGRQINTAPDFVENFINKVLKEGWKLTDKGNNEFRLYEHSNHWLEIKTK